MTFTARPIDARGIPMPAALARASVPPFSHVWSTVDGCALQIVDQGPTEASRSTTWPDELHGALPLLLVHGGHGGWMHWRANIGPLSAHRRVVAPEMPGFGLSADPPSRTVDAMASVLSSLVDTLSLQRFMLVGYSFGSVVATALAALRPDAVDRVLLINPPGWGERSPETIAGYAASAEIARREGIRAGVQHTLSHLMLWHTDLIDEACVDVTEAGVRNCRFLSRDLSVGADMASGTSRLPMPVHVCFGAEDPSHRYRLEERRVRLAAARGQPCTTIIEHARHWAQFDRADKLNDLIEAYALGHALPERVAADPTEETAPSGSSSERQS